MDKSKSRVKDPRRWLNAAPMIAKHEHIRVVRDDVLEGGSKLRFLPFLVRGFEEIVYGAPFCGGAPLALSVIGRESGQKVTIFYAGRAQLHRRQEQVKANGAVLRFVRPGYMTCVQARAKAYAQNSGAYFLPLGFDVPEAVEPFLQAIERVRKVVGDPPQVWCATGSGMLARCLALGFPSSEVKAVTVGLRSRHGKQEFPKNVALIEQPLAFEQRCRAESPFPSCPNYDLKAWEICQREAVAGALFWNVMGA